MTTKKALLVVSFGTTYQDTLEKNIAAVERAIANALPDRTLFRAFTSGMIMKKLRERDNLIFDSVPQALERLLTEGYTEVLLQPTHMMNGDEYEKLQAQAAPLKGKFTCFQVGNPLLTRAEDYLELARVLMDEIPTPAEDEAIIFMGHGTGHFANAAYCQLEYVLQDRGWSRAFVGTVEGYPALDEVLRRLGAQPKIRRVRLYPLMLVAGDHARNDMAGDGADSWRTRLEAKGFGVSCTLRGLGESAGVQAMFAQRAARAEASNDKSTGVGL